jgi:hypothetical protein
MDADRPAISEFIQYGNSHATAAYYQTWLDRKGQTLDGKSLNKYLVGSYTPGLRKGPDGSVAIFIAPKQPKYVPAPNWLPVPDGGFSLMLRVYGPKGSVKRNTYVPPAVVEAK